jgi:phosphonoacetate hydrolase
MKSDGTSGLSVFSCGYCIRTSRLHAIYTVARHSANGVTGNTYYDPERDEQSYMNDPSHLRCRTELQRRADRDETVVALVAKDKLVGIVGRGCDIAASAEDPPDWLAAAVGKPPGIYSGGASAWLLDAAAHVLDPRCAVRLDD